MHRKVITLEPNCQKQSSCALRIATTELPLVIATMHRPQGVTGVQTHVAELRTHLQRRGMTARLVTPFSWGGPLAVPVFAPRLVLSRLNAPAGLMWHRHWHEAFLRRALLRELADVDECVVYAQGPLAARAALRARRSSKQRVVMAIHFRTSQADEWVEADVISRQGRVYRAIRQAERDVIPRVDGLVAVTRWARDALISWLPEAQPVPYSVINNFLYWQPVHESNEGAGDLVSIGRLEPVKNHRFILEILACAKNMGRRYTLDIYGEGPDHDDIARFALSLGLREQVRLQGFRSDIRTVLPGYRAYIHAAYSESSSLAIMESMAAGLPIVAGYLQPLAELCQDGVEARFFALGDPGRAASTLIDLLESESDRAAAAAAARQRFEREFDSEVVAPRLLSFLQATTDLSSREYDEGQG